MVRWLDMSSFSKTMNKIRKGKQKYDPDYIIYRFTQKRINYFEQNTIGFVANYRLEHEAIEIQDRNQTTQFSNSANLNVNNFTICRAYAVHGRINTFQLLISKNYFCIINNFGYIWVAFWFPETKPVLQGTNSIIPVNCSGLCTVCGTKQNKPKKVMESDKKTWHEKTWERAT